MITKFKQSWLLFKASITLTLRHRKLLWFPVLNVILLAFIAFFFLSAMAIPMALHHTGYRLNQLEHWESLGSYYFLDSTQPKSTNAPAESNAHVNFQFTNHHLALDKSGHPIETYGLPWVPIVLVLVYFISMFLATFFNVAFYSEIISALNGRGVSFRRGLGLAWSRLPSILAWSLLAGLVGWLIRMIEERLPLAGRIIGGLIGLGWSIAAVFAIPVIIQEQPTRNPIKILQQSAMTLKRTWGEGLIGYLGFSAGSMLIFVGSLIPLLLAAALAYAFKSVWIIAIAAVFWVLGLLIMAYVSGVAGHVYRCALYMYAAEGVVPEPYNQDLMDMAWKVKKSSSE
jgi:hypothetical protein